MHRKFRMHHSQQKHHFKENNSLSLTHTQEGTCTRRYSICPLPLALVHPSHQASKCNTGFDSACASAWNKAMRWA